MTPPYKTERVVNWNNRKLIQQFRMEIMEITESCNPSMTRYAACITPHMNFFFMCSKGASHDVIASWLKHGTSISVSYNSRLGGHPHNITVKQTMYALYWNLWKTTTFVAENSQSHTYSLKCITLMSNRFKVTGNKPSKTLTVNYCVVARLNTPLCVCPWPIN